MLDGVHLGGKGRFIAHVPLVELRRGPDRLVGRHPEWIYVRISAAKARPLDSYGSKGIELVLKRNVAWPIKGRLY